MNEIFRWTKACDCDGTATSGRVVITRSEPAPNGDVRFRATHHPGPVCDVCDTPWRGPHFTLNAAAVSNTTIALSSAEPTSHE